MTGITMMCVCVCVSRRQRAETVFSFHLDTEWCGGQRVERSGQGLLQVWRRQVQQLNRVSADVASAVVAAYPSPQLLNKVLVMLTLSCSLANFQLFQQRLLRISDLTYLSFICLVSVLLPCTHFLSGEQVMMSLSYCPYCGSVAPTTRGT